MAQKENSDGFLHRWPPTQIMLVFPEDLINAGHDGIFGQGKNIDREGERERERGTIYMYIYIYICILPSVFDHDSQQSQPQRHPI